MSIKTMEDDIRKLQKERDELFKQQKADSTSKIAEQRRKRINELEQQMAAFKKKMLEQQRAIKLNEKNESKVKQLAEEIRQMKAAKVKLIRQMREDAERIRLFKTQKEKEVAALKQTERRQQVKIAKMENIHTKRQNVLQRKLEESQASKKRMEEIIQKQKNNNANRIAGKQGLAGAAERMKNLVNHELDVVVTIKDATKNREQLLEDRKLLTKKLNDIAKQSRQTLVGSEREDMEQKRKSLKAELDMANNEIQHLQKQIMEIKEQAQGVGSFTGLPSAVNGEKGGKQWWDTVQSMTEAKLAIEHLFEKSAELMCKESLTNSEKKELQALYDEASRNTVTLEAEIGQMKADHTQDVATIRREYEDAQCILLSRLANPEDSPVMSEQEIKKISDLHNRVEEMMKYSDSPPSGTHLNKKSSIQVDDDDYGFRKSKKSTSGKVLGAVRSTNKGNIFEARLMINPSYFKTLPIRC